MRLVIEVPDTIDMEEAQSFLSRMFKNGPVVLRNSHAFLKVENPGIIGEFDYANWKGELINIVPLIPEDEDAPSQ